MKTRNSNPLTPSILIPLLLSSAVLGDWSPGDSYKMHSPQLPNPNGWDICLVHQAIADDFQCAQSGPISDIHFWVSWKGDDTVFKSRTWQVSICADRAGQPGVTLWTLGSTNATISSRLYGKGDQGWYCPNSPISVPHDHTDIYQVNITEIRDPYNQTKGRLYWLVIGAQVSPSRAEVGWKTSTSSYFGQAQCTSPLGGWLPTGKAHDLAFVITGGYPVEVDMSPMSQPENDLITPLGKEKLTVNGPFTWRVFFEGPLEGDAHDDDGDGLDEVELEIVDLDWTDTGPLLGPIKLREHPAIPSVGLIEEQANNTPGKLDVPPFTTTGTASLTLELYFEIEFAGQVLYTNQPSRLSTVITHKPPGYREYFSTDNRYLPLLNADGSISRCYFALGSDWARPFWEVDPLDFSAVYLEISMSGGTPETIALSGFSSMYTAFEGHEEGQADDDDDNGLDEVATEMAALDLAGSGPTLGPVNMRLRPGIRTLGQIEETANNIPGILDLPPFVATCWAHSFFDVFFEVEIGGQVYHNIQPLRLTDSINHKPPRGASYHSTEVIPLVHADGSPSPYTIIDSRYAPGYCGDSTHPIPIGDLNRDCLVDFRDFAVFADHWLECTRALCP